MYLPILRQASTLHGRARPKRQCNEAAFQVRRGAAGLRTGAARGLGNNTRSGGLLPASGVEPPSAKVFPLSRSAVATLAVEDTLFRRGTLPENSDKDNEAVSTKTTGFRDKVYDIPGRLDNTGPGPAAMRASGMGGARAFTTFAGWKRRRGVEDQAGQKRFQTFKGY